MKVAFDGTMNSNPTLKIDGSHFGGRDPVAGYASHRWPTAVHRTRLQQIRTQGDHQRAGGGTAALSPMNIELDGNAAEGVLSYTFGSRRSLQGTLAAENIDLTPYVSTFHILANNARDWNRSPLTLDGILPRRMWISVLSAARIAIGNTKIGRTALAANMRGTAISTWLSVNPRPSTVSLPDRFSIAKTKSGANIKSQMQFADVDLNRALSQLFGVKRLEGKERLFSPSTGREKMSTPSRTH